MTVSVNLTVNGKPASASVDSRTLLVHLLRDQLHLTATACSAATLCES